MAGETKTQKPTAEEREAIDRQAETKPATRVEAEIDILGPARAAAARRLAEQERQEFADMDTRIAKVTDPTSANKVIQEMSAERKEQEEAAAARRRQELDEEIRRALKDPVTPKNN